MPPLQFAQVPASTPQADFAVPGAQLPFDAQQPPHATLSHWHTPPTQCLPTGHWVVAPHRQAPVSEQLSARMGSQAVHAAPGAAQVAVVRGKQVAPEQQPVRQVTALHPVQTPPSHAPVPQLWQAPPAAPHAVAEFPGWQTFPAQQPDGHDAALQTQVPPTHSWPGGHAADPPQRHTPALVQSSAVGPQFVQVPPAVPHCDVDERH